MGVPLLIAINPPNGLSKKVLKLKEFIVKRTGKFYYAQHDPHITLFVNSFPSFSAVEDKFNLVVKKYKQFIVKIDGLDTFTFDPIFNTNTITYKVEKSKILSKIQNEIVDILNPLRTQDQANWLLKQNPNPLKQHMENISKYGYPFGPKDWVFHLTIGSVPKEIYEEIWKEVKKYNSHKKFLVKEICIFIHLGDDGFKLYKKYKLKK